MKQVRLQATISLFLLFLLLTVTTAIAQQEVDPDHFDDTPAPVQTHPPSPHRKPVKTTQKRTHRKHTITTAKLNSQNATTAEDQNRK